MKWFFLAVAFISLLGIRAGKAADTRPLGEVVVVVTADGKVLVGVGEPPGEDRIPVLVYFGIDGGAAADIGSDAGVGGAVSGAEAARSALSGLPALRRFTARGAPAERVAVLDAQLTDAGFATERVDAPENGTDPTAQMTADLYGFHRRDQAGRPAADAGEAVRWLISAARYGHGHGEPAFETGPDGQPRMLRPPGWREQTTGYACPFPVSPMLSPPPGMALEIYQVGDQTGIAEEAMASWCDGAARALLSGCGGDGLLEQLEPGPAEVHWRLPPGEGLWWVVPERIIPPGGSAMGAAESCLTEALEDWEIAALHHGTVMRVRLVENDLQQGCARDIQEKCD